MEFLSAYTRIEWYPHIFVLESDGTVLWPAEFEPLYGQMLDRVAANVVEKTDRSLPPEAVVKVIYAALTSKRPRTRYAVGVGRPDGDNDGLAARRPDV